MAYDVRHVKDVACFTSHQMCVMLCVAVVFLLTREQVALSRPSRGWGVASE